MAEKQTPRASLLPLASTLLVGTVALYMALVVFGNITDFGTNQRFVRHVFAMDTTFKDEDLMWRAIESKAVQDTAYVLVIIGETVAALVLLAATCFWATALRSRVFHTARRYSTLGLLMVLLLFGAGFIAVGGEWFVMWQSGDWNGLDAALRVFVLAGVVLLVTYLPTDDRADG